MAAAVVAVAAGAILFLPLAQAERVQKGDLIVSLDGGLLPRKLPRDHPAPVGVHVEGGLQTTDGSLLPRVTRLEVGLPSQGILSTRGLPTCSVQRLRNTRSAEALAACRPALIGHGRLEADVLVPHQEPFKIDARLLAFNGRIAGRRAVILHGASADPPTVVVLPFIIRHRGGRLGTALVANLPPALGPWPRLADFELTLSRRYVYRGKGRSYLSASCPTTRRFPSAFFSFASSTYTLAGGRQITISIPRSCRAR